MKKQLRFTTSIITLFLVLFLFGCDLSNTPIEDNNEQIMTIYNMAVEVNVTNLTYEEWLISVQGPQGESGKEIILQVAEGYIQWQYTGEEIWNNLIELTTLTGSAGIDGVDGINGIDGVEVLFQVADGYIQWQYTGEETWSNLIELTTLTGSAGVDGTNGTDGTNGLDGLEVLFQVADGYIQWQYTGDLEWNNLIEINTLTGVQGIGITNTSINEFGELIITYTDDTIVNIGQIYIVNTVNFIGFDGYMINTQSIMYGNDAIEPTAPEVNGHTFVGWSLDFTNVTGNLTITANYQINTYTITFDTEGGDNINPLTSIEYGSYISSSYLTAIVFSFV